MNKKANSLEENVPSIIISVIVVLMIVFAVYKLYVVISKNEADNAKNVAELIKGKADALSAGQKASLLLQGFKQDNLWVIVGWSKNELGRPGRCELESCICVCKHSAGSTRTELAQSCQDKGFCRFYDEDIINIRASYSGGKGDYFIDLPKNVKEISIEKTQDTLSVYSDEQDRIILPGGVAEQGVPAGG